MSAKFVIVTPVKNEEKYLQITIDSVVNQTILPDKWIIVNDGSTDRTGEIIRENRIKYPWILCRNNPEGRRIQGRRMGGQAVIHVAVEKLNLEDYDFIVRMDADVKFEESFLNDIFREFDMNKKLGIASGVCFVKDRGKLIEEEHPRFHTRGPLKVYKKECFQEIGGFIPEEGWDTIDEVKANMLKWQTRSFPNLRVLHLRKTQTASGRLRGRLNLGRTAYFIGYHPIFMFGRSIKRMLKRPYFLGGIWMFAGFMEGYFKKLPRYVDQNFRQYLRQQQLNKILGKETIWR